MLVWRKARFHLSWCFVQTKNNIRSPAQHSCARAPAVYGGALVLFSASALQRCLGSSVRIRGRRRCGKRHLHLQSAFRPVAKEEVVGGFAQRRSRTESHHRSGRQVVATLLARHLPRPRMEVSGCYELRGAANVRQKDRSSFSV